MNVRTVSARLSPQGCLRKAVSARVSLQHYQYSQSSSPYSKIVGLTSLRNVLEICPRETPCHSSCCSCQQYRSGFSWLIAALNLDATR
ncbi:hypothetical protein L211DRAFT_288211 [Terfezia boudieri ATCC MYA-4762]|uniref:Uncharacterized protein n=1 Tax=Terfezia boudieri ATCC MYA-4762 TaxID=1051890 RepID=A0A3N4LKD2_9PEZI|nr:hypothetical protein L211DRAFT_288211 [Terfezia boudieri ATCC MYA-4762]